MTITRNEIALITGASSGIGREFAVQLQPRCSTMVLHGRDEQKLQELASELQQPGLTLYCISADLTTTLGTAKLLEAIRQKGPISILINNAGCGSYGPFAQHNIDQQNQMLLLHCQATMALCRGALPYMQELGRGKIVNVSSVLGFVPVAELAVYSASKAFLNSFTSALQDEVAGQGINLQALCPGYTRTNFHSRAEASSFDASQVSDDAWSSTEEVVSASLDALFSEACPLYVIPGDGNRNWVQSYTAQLAQSLAD